MLDFTSALYLGLQHPSASLRSWDSLSTGRPAALGEPPGAEAVAAELAMLQGCERAVLLPSTLHLFMDLFEALAKDPVAIFLDADAYPIARWGAERIAGRGVPLRVFPHHDPDGLAGALRRSPGVRPVVVTDGFCPLCGGAAPLPDYLAVVRRCGGMLVVDDTQALGILGEEPGPDAPYGRGGGGSLRWWGLRGPDILVGTSLAKAFGVPIAALSGSESRIRRFLHGSNSRVHCSPPSVAVIRAAEQALAVNRRCGDLLRLRLAQRVRRFRGGLRRAGLIADGGFFPVQSLRPIRGRDAPDLHRLLLRRGIRTVPLRRREREASRLGFLVTACHGPEQIDYCVATLVAMVAAEPRQARLAGPVRSSLLQPDYLEVKHGTGIQL